MKNLKSKKNNCSIGSGYHFFSLFLLCFLLAACSSSQQTSDADNSKKNLRDVQGGPLTPESQSNNKEDIDITQRIRSAIQSDDSLSTNAKNIKIITINKIVTLRGPVNDEGEKDKISSKARDVAGTENVVNQLEIISH